MQLDLPEYKIDIKLVEGKKYIYDKTRRKWLVLTPEEYVRQHFVEFLVNEKNVGRGLIAIEKKVVYNNLTKRFDILVYNQSGKMALLVECKAPNVALNQDVLFQAAAYNKILNVNWLVLTNGLQHLCCYIDPKSEDINYSNEIPNAEEL